MFRHHDWQKVTPRLSYHSSSLHIEFYSLEPWLLYLWLSEVFLIGTEIFWASLSHRRKCGWGPRGIWAVTSVTLSTWYCQIYSDIPIHNTKHAVLPSGVNNSSSCFLLTGLTNLHIKTNMLLCTTIFTVLSAMFRSFNITLCSSCLPVTYKTAIRP